MNYLILSENDYLQLKERYGKSAQIRYEGKTKEPIYPIGYIKFTKPMNHGRDVCS